MEKEIKVIDAVIYVLDARAPLSCVNPKLNEIARGKPVIYVLNKGDLVEKKDLDKWVKYFTKYDKNKKLISAAVGLNSTLSGSSKKIVALIKELLADKIENAKQKGINKIIRTMVVGVPNSGKSTLINNLAGRGKTATGDTPGVTRGKQWVTIENGIEILDTPGTLWGNLEDPNVAFNLALIGSINPDVLDAEELAFAFLEHLKAFASDAINKRYNILCKSTDETLKIFDEICEARKCVLKGGEYDYERCAKIIIDDFRTGKFGKIVLD